MSKLSFELRPVTYALTTPLLTASGTYSTRQSILVLARDGDRAGAGEAAPLESFGTESYAQAARMLAEVIDRWEGAKVPKKPDQLAPLFAKLELERHPATAHALECALLDLIAQQDGVPLASLLWRGPYARSVRVSALITAGTPEAAAMQAREAAAAGHDTLKVKVATGPLSEDVLRLEAIRAAAPALKVRIDANGGWTRQAAEEALRTLAPLDLELCEQPLAAEDLEGLVALRRQQFLPIAADESLGLPNGLERVVAADAADVLVLKPMVLGGIRRAVEAAGRASKRGVGAYVTSSLEGPIGRLAALQVAAAIGDRDHAHGLAVGALFGPSARPQLLEPINGRLSLLDGPGIGLLD